MVEDQGPGIPAEANERIFDRFYQVDQSKTRNVGGTGLGLYICRKLAEAIGGTLSLDAGYDDGCRFQLRIPRKVAREMPLLSDVAVHEPSAAERAMAANGNGHPVPDLDTRAPAAAIRKSEEITRGRVVAFMSSVQEL